MGAVCCSPSVAGAIIEVSEQSPDITSKLQAGSPVVSTAAKGEGKGKGKGKSSCAPLPSKGKGKGHSAISKVSKADVGQTDASKSKPCPICQTPGHIASDCPEKGTVKKDSASISSDMLVNLVNMYEVCGGDVVTIADSCKCSAEKLRQHPPVDADDFARKFVAGRYTIPSNRGTSNGWSASSGMGGA
jgi:hypothetical protein